MKFIRLLSTILVWITIVNTTQTTATPLKQNRESTKSFAQWCKQKLTLSKHTKHTVEVLLKKAGTQDCAKAQQKLKKLSKLNLDENQIRDLSPLTGLTNLNLLNLSKNQISDTKPLTKLPNLTELYLNKNQISDTKPLAALTKLSWLELEDNQIGDIKPLTGLTNLTKLRLKENQIQNTTCPVKPESICEFQ